MSQIKVAALIVFSCAACATLRPAGPAPMPRAAQGGDAAPVARACEGQAARASARSARALEPTRAPLTAAHEGIAQDDPQPQAAGDADDAVPTVQDDPPPMAAIDASGGSLETAPAQPTAPQDADADTNTDADTAPSLAALEAPTQTSVAQLHDPARYRDVVSERGQQARGLYFTEFMTRRLGATGIARIVRGAGLNAAVIDLKDQEGRVGYDTHVAALQAEKQVLVRDMPGLVHELKAAGIYTIGRIVCFSDPVLPRVQPDRAVMDARPQRVGQIWNQRGTNTWLDPYNPDNHDMVVDLAVEAESLGFDEVQLDYIRFPVDDGTKFALFPAQSETPRREVLLGLLARVDEAVHVPLGVDVFGLTTIRSGDPAGLGQALEVWAKHVDVFTPMLYVNGMKGWLSHKAQGRAGLLVEVAVRALRERVGPVPVIRPFLQAFATGADYYNGAFITEQIRGARVGGGDGFLFWNPASSYGIVREAMANGARAEVPVATSERRDARLRRWGQTALREPQASLPLVAKWPQR